ncbi:MAG TPA: hypothetical protein DHN33_11555 [Eubacteriaceae bacterium]|nr:hypothetical protein [Eubacteriaceae bacterium]
MGDLIVACEILKDELEKARKDVGNEDPVIWMDSLLHMEPNRLREALQEVIDEHHQKADHILLAYGNCGGGLVGLEAKETTLVIPKTADCISLLLHKDKEVDHLRKNTYFLTKGWLRCEKNLISEYEHSLEKYGEEKAKQIFKVMLNHYENLMLIDTGAYDVKKYRKIAENIADKLEMNVTFKKGTPFILQKILDKQWGPDFTQISPGGSIQLHDFDLDEEEKTYVNLI